METGCAGSQRQGTEESDALFFAVRVLSARHPKMMFAEKFLVN